MLKRKRALSWVLSLVMLLTLATALPVIVSAEPTTVCQIGSTGYSSLNDALAAVADGETITLLQDIDYTSSIRIEDKDITFDIDDYNLNVNTSTWPALFVDNGSVSLQATIGSFNVTCNAADGYGVYVSNGGSAEVSNVSNPNLGYGVYANGGTVTVSGNVQSGYEGVYVSNGTVTVAGDVVGGYYGIYASTNGIVSIGGNSTGNNFNGVFAGGGSQVTVEGDVYGANEGAYAEDNGTSISIEGNVTSTNSTGAYANVGTTITILGNATGCGHGVYSYDASIHVYGNVTSNDCGVYVVYGEATIDGIITAANFYMGIDGDHIAADAGVAGTAPYEDYLIYSGSQGGVVRVKIQLQPVCEIGSTQYYSFSEALSAVTEGQTIKLLDNIVYNDRLWAGSSYRDSLILDLNGKRLEISDVECPIAAIDGYSIDVLDNSIAGGGTLILNTTSDDSAPSGVSAVGNGSRVTIDDEVTATITGNGSNSKGIHAYNGGTVEIGNGTISGGGFGLLSERTGSNITLTGSVSGGWIVIHAIEGGNVIMNGNVATSMTNSYGVRVTNGSTAAITGNVSATGGGNYGVSASNGTLNVIGDVTSGSVGAWAADGGDITIAGDILAEYMYIQLETVGNYINIGQFTTPTTKNGYRTYTDGSNTVWVEDDPLPSDNADLSSLSASGISLSPAFNSAITSYTANVGNSIKSTTVSAVTSDDSATVSINGDIGLSREMALDVGSNTITVEVTAEDGTTTKTYTITITRAAGGGSSGGGGSYTPPAVVVKTNTTGGSTSNSITIGAVVSSGTASASVTKAMAEALLDKAIDSGGTAKDDRIEVFVNTAAAIERLQVSIPQAELDKIASRTDANFGIESPFVSIVFDGKAVETISGAASAGNVVITAQRLADINGRPVYDLTVTNGGKTVSDFEGGHATVTVPYTLKPGENANAVVIYYLADDGTLRPVHGHYDADLKAVVFKTNHFSQFTIGYNPVSFNDVAAPAWYKDAVDFIAARGITTGTGSNNFSPEAKLTRAQFVVLLMNAYQISPHSQGGPNFADAGNTYYTDYLAAAKNLGIVNGIGNNLFAPDKEITRQEMSVMLYNALKVIDAVPDATNNIQLSSFNDASNAADWAQEALSCLIKAGIVGGYNNNLYPTSTTTRAETAQVFYNLLSK